MRKIFVNVDGSSHGSPGEAAIGILITDEKGQVLGQESKLIGRATSDVAEYKALLDGIRLALALSPDEAVFLTDNQVVANQVNGFYQVREPHLELLNRNALDLLSKLPRWRVNFVEREINHPAHRLAEQAFRERSRQERERADLTREIGYLLDGLPVDELRRLVAYVRSLRP
ncbi:MAG TPA: ribonuclease HI family protein [Candidatus Bipolaricaulis anaerobius]|nr:ribonuclease HI family protein [Candidatus Bipolaricaulis anaerobius]HNR24802.1 ribonuclease HI family protein [Candidatus Bipolaricaulis anaerobius]HNS24155.1 ribonuclease HI family protein [Candidatus Bipolaricaulis anaerobius]